MPAERLAGAPTQVDAGLDMLRAVEISALISLAASAERCASARTSEATTAKPAARLAGARRFDAGIERQEVGLEGDLVDHADDLADLLDELSILLIAAIASRTTSPLFAASVTRCRRRRRWPGRRLWAVLSPWR